MKSTIACALLAYGMCWVTTTSGAPLYNIATLGFTDVEHTRNDGYRLSNGSLLNAAGQAAGVSDRFNGGSAQLGQTVWLYDGGSTINVTPTGSQYTRSDGRKYSVLIALNEAGQVLGYAERYTGSTYWGKTAWLYNGSTTLDVGLTGSGYTRDDGYENNTPIGLNEAGQVAGWGYRHSGSAYMGQAAWLYDGSSTFDIGLADAEHVGNSGVRSSTSSYLNGAGQVAGTALRFNGGSTSLGQSTWLYDGSTTAKISPAGSEHTRTDGYRYSYPVAFNQAGQVLGTADRYDGGSTPLGQSVWLYDGSTTVDVGFTGSEHTRSDGYKYSGFLGMNEAGQAAGTSSRFNGSTPTGASAWFYDGTTTVDVGLTDSAHTDISGSRFSVPQILNESGNVAGYAARYGGAAPGTQDAWVYDGTTTTVIGLYDAEHTRDDNYQFNETKLMNESGQVAGIARRYNGGNPNLGVSSWLYDGTTTVKLNPTDVMHTRSDGAQSTNLLFLNDNGQVAGQTYRYNGGTSLLGFTSWLYDPVLAQRFDFDVSVRSDGYSASSLFYLGDDGLALGSVELYDNLDNLTGVHAFSFSVEDGFEDLGLLISGGLTANGWEQLHAALKANEKGQIMGAGTLLSQNGGYFTALLTPVPEPCTLILGILGLGVLMLRLPCRLRARAGS